MRINDKSLFSFSGLNTAYASLTDVSGFSWDQLQHTEANPTDTHGIIDYQSFMKWRLITLKWWVVGKTEEDCVRLCNELSSAFSIPLSPKTRKDWYRQLVFRHHSDPSTKYFVDAKPHKLIEITKKMHIGRLRLFEIQLRVENPFIYTLDETVIGLTTSSSRWENLPSILWSAIGPKANISVSNNSNYETYLRYSISGTFQNYRITNKTTWAYQEMTGIWCEENESIEVDWRTAYAYKWTDKLYWYISWESSWVVLVPWNNDIEIDFGSIVSPTWDVSLPNIELAYRGIYLTMS